MIVWDVNPEIFSFGFVTVRWYGLLFAMGFVFGFPLLNYMYKREGRNPEDLNDLLIYIVAGTVIGARLGHCLFYAPEYYLSRPWEILFVWNGGLASHGGLIGNLIAIWLYSKRYKNQPFLWVADRLAIAGALGGAFIRLGNLFNSEIYGHETDLPWGVVFKLRGETVPKHPTQIYESLAYLAVYVILLMIYRKKGPQLKQGYFLGLFLILVFTFRFLVEFVKNNQSAFEAGMPLNMGQLLSIPAVLVGIYLMLYYKNNKTQKA